MAVEFDDSAHYGIFTTAATLTSSTGKMVRQSELVLAALRAQGVFNNLVDSLTAPAITSLWLDKNFDPAVLKEWDSIGSAWVAMTFDRMFGRAVATALTVTGGTANAITVSAPAAFIDNRLYSIIPTATNTGATTIQVAGVGTYNVVYGNGDAVQAGDIPDGQLVPLLFTNGRFELIYGSSFGKQPLSSNLSTLAGIVPGAAGQAILADATTANVRDYLGADIGFATRTAAAAYAPDAAPDFLRVAGYSAAGDGGGALYKKVAAEPTHAGKFSITLSDAVTVVWYELAEDAVKPRMFGTGDGATELQAAIDYAVAKGGDVEVHIPNDLTLTAGVTHNSATPVTLRGIGRRVSKLSAGATFAALLTLGAASVGFQCYNVDFYAGATTTKCVDVANGAVDFSFYESKFRGDTAGLSLVYSAASGFPEWHNCHWVMNNATCLGLEFATPATSTNQVWRLFNPRFSGVGRGFKVTGTGTDDVEGGRCIGGHFVNTGDWAVNLGPSFDTAFIGTTFDQQTVSCVILGLNADRVTFADGCYFGAPAGNTTAVLLDITATSGNDVKVIGSTFNGGGQHINARATATAGEYLNGLQVAANTFLNAATTTLALNSVMKCSIFGNVDKGTPTNGSWTTSASNAVNGQYSFNGNHWHTTSPATFSTAAAYKWGNDTGIVMRNRVSGTAAATTSLSVAHGLSKAPSWAVVSANANVGNGPWISVLNSTNVGASWQNSASPTLYFSVEV
jgi:hypothetical protein